MKEIDKEGLERIFEFHKAFDKRDPDPKKNYGVHGAEMRFVLKGPLGAVQLVVYTNWYLDKVKAEFEKTNPQPFIWQPMPADLGYHSITPQYDDQEPMHACPYLDGKPCYYDGSGLQAKGAFDILVAKGEEALWQFLRRYYRYRLVDSNYTEEDPVETARENG